jgi:hypothetical protein
MYQALALGGVASAIFVVGRLAREGRSRLSAYLTYAVEGYAASFWGSIKFLLGRGVPARQGAGQRLVDRADGRLASLRRSVDSRSLFGAEAAPASLY